MKRGQASAAALSHTVMTMDNAGAEVPVNSSQLLLRKPRVSMPLRLNTASACGFTTPPGALPAL